MKQFVPLYTTQIYFSVISLSFFMFQLEVLSTGEAPCFLTSELSEEQSQNISAFLDLLKCDQLDKMSSTSLSSYNGCQISTTDHSDPSLASELNGSSSTPEEQNGCHTAVSHENGCSTKASRKNVELMYAMQMLMNALEGQYYTYLTQRFLMHKDYLYSLINLIVRFRADGCSTGPARAILHF